METTVLKRTAILFASLLILFLPSRAFALADILNIRHWVAPDNTRIVIDTSEEAVTTVDKTERKVTIDFKDAQVLGTVPLEKVLNKPGINKILVLTLPGQVVRVELWLADYVETRVFQLQAVADKPYRVVIDIELPEIGKKESEERKQIKTRKKDKVIVIDPGHGGDDPGAIGRRKTKEKDVVLKISRRLEKIINEREGYRAFLTRRGDYYPSFKKRLQIAREYGADLFVSIHADSVRSRNARGSSVYCLSTSGASSVAARLLASQENLADIIGGAENDLGTDETDPITLHMVQTENMNQSRNLGAAILDRLKTVNPLKFRQVQAAPLRVLKLPEIPSVLVETAYISNPKEEALLRSPAFQNRIAEAIADSIDDFLSNGEGEGSQPAVTASKAAPQETEAPTKTAAAAETPPPKPAPATILYRVKRGDTLGKIAARHKTTIAVLLRLNKMKLREPLYVGRTLKVPAGRAVAAEAPAVKPSPKTKAKPVFYRVKRGDTLEKIARKHDTTIAALLKLNHMKLRDPLYVGKNLKIR